MPTSKQSPEGAGSPSHALLLRAGLISQVMPGAFAYLPLGLRSLNKVVRIVREEMEAAGAVELLLPALSPISLWEQTGRMEAFGDELIRLTLQRQNRKIPVALGPSHEDVVTALVSKHISSYRQMPLTLFQVQTKFRNEQRPRSGIVRTIEFLMKDAYSFDTSIEASGKSYQRMYAAYCRIFDRCGLQYLAVEAESEPFGGNGSHEFMIVTDNGEEPVLHCAACGYAADQEKAEIGAQDCVPCEEPIEPVRRVETPGATTIEQVSRFLQCTPRQMIKTLIYVADGQPVAVLIRGDHEANESKIRRALGARKVQLADPPVIERVTGSAVGFAGPVGLKEKLPIWVDRSLSCVRNAVAGANATDTHLTGVTIGRDFEATGFADLRNARDGDPCPRCSSTVSLRRAIEVGHVFKLGTSYSEALNAKFRDAQEQLLPVVMGCYQIGINRVLASLVETNHDADGIIWPVALAPYEVVLLPVNALDAETNRAAVELHEALQASGVDVLLDDRDLRVGVKFKDADLIGFPLRIVIGERGLQQGKLEMKWRWDEKREMIDREGAAGRISELIGQERKRGQLFRARRGKG